MNKSCLIGFLMCSAFSLVVQAATDGAHITKTISQIERKKGIKRTIQYRPDGNDFVCVNGKNRYTRALYGGITDFRIETSDLCLLLISRRIVSISVFACNVVIKV